MYGMSSEEFWEDDPRLYWSYRTFYLKKLEEQEALIDYKCWLNGFYTYNALSNIVASFFDKSGKEHNYIEKPISVIDREKKEEKQETKKIDKNLKQQLEFNSWARF